MEADRIIIEPVVTEKTNIMRETDKKKYVFKVDSRANKHQILDAVKKLFSVNPLACNIINVKRKPRTARTKSGYKKGHTAAWKKAVITLKAGEKIDVFEGA